MAPKLSARGKVKDLGEVKFEKPKAHWTTANKKLFLDLAVEEKHKGNRPGKAFNAVGWENIIKEFNAKTGTQYEFLQFKNLYGSLRSSWQTWRSLIMNTGLGYDPDAKTFTLDDDRWNELIKANPKLREFRYKPLQFEAELDNLFTGNSATGENAWAPTTDAPMPSEGPTPNEDACDTHSDYMESYNTNLLSDATDGIEDLKAARGKKLKKSSEKTPTRSRKTFKGDISQCMDTFTEVAKTLIASKSSMTSSGVLTDSIKAAIDILNNTEGIEVASPFWVSATEVLENETKRTLWLQMPESGRLPWMTKQVDKMT